MPNIYFLPFTSHQDRPARLGETVSFFGCLLVDSRKIYDGTIKWRLERNCNELVAVGEYPSSSYTQGAFLKAERPGYYKCTFEAYLKGERVASSVIGALVAPEQIQPGLPVPDDFDAFWRRHTAEVDAIPSNAKLTPLEKNGLVEVFDLQADCVGNVPVSGIFARPAGAKVGGHPAILVPHGAGVRSAGEGRFLSFACKGFLALDINAHGLPNGQPPEWYDKVAQEKLADYRIRGFDTGNPDNVYMLGLFQRVYRALQVLADMPEWDGRNLWVFGGSQGSWQSFAGAALMPKVSGMAAWIPAGADIVNGGWPFAHLIGKPVSDKLKRTMAYFDSTSLATRIKDIPVICSMGLIDGTCKADGVMAAYNSLATSDKTLDIHYQMNHETLESVIATLERFIMSHLK